MAACETPVTVTGALPEGCEMARVLRVVDGDTIHIDSHGTDETVRYIGIDTPETKKPDTPGQPFGPEASALNARLVAGKTVCLERDISERDRFGRLLRYVWLKDGTLVNERLLSEGLATVTTFPPDVKYVESRYLPAQEAARAAGRGVWR